MEHSTPTIHLVNGLKSLVETLENRGNGLETASNVLEPEPPPTQNQTPLVQTDEGRSSYCGTDLQALCDEGCFEDVMWLLINRSRPDHEQLADTVAILNDAAVIDRPLAETISTVPLQTRPLDFFPLSISLLSCFDPTPSDVSAHATRSQFWRLMAQLPVLMHVALGGDIEDGRPVFPEGCSDPEISADIDEPATSWAGRLLQILRTDNHPVSATEEHAMNVLMTCECMTDERAADCTARSVGAAVTDIIAAWKASSAVFVSQLRNDPYSWTATLMRSFVNPSYAEQWWASRGGKGMPFGFAAAPEEDRSMLLREQCQELLGSVPAMVMEASCSRLEAVRAEDDRFPTTDWTATRLLSLLGVPEDRISVAIGMARLVGWAAHHLDQCERGSVD
ncbi:MAG: citrate/2-methylcitrate synthase [Fuerstiella sp.]